MSEEKKPVAKTADLEKDPLLGYGEWEVEESADDLETDLVAGETDQDDAWNKGFDGFEAYDSE